MRLLIAAGICLLTVQAWAIDTSVGMVQGAPSFIVDGQPNPGVSFMTYCGPNAVINGEKVLPKYARQFSEAGADMFTFVVDLGGVYGYTNTVWPEENRFDFSVVDQNAQTIVDAAGPSAKLIIQLYIDAPEWWCKAHPDELMRLADGATSFSAKHFALPRQADFPSMASDTWRGDMKKVVEALIDHVQAGPYATQVAGYQICGQKTEEWYHWSMNNPELGDYSAPMTSAWRAWLRSRYPDDAALQQAWHQPDASRDGAAIPSQERRFGETAATFRHPEKEQDVIDFHRFWSDIMADTIAYFAKVVKEKTNHRKVVGGFYAYTFEFAGLAEDAGHLALGKLLTSPDMDFIMSPGSYHRRNLKGGQSLFRMPVLSLNLHGKMLWNDFDAASFKFYGKDQEALKPWKDQLAVTDTPEEFGWMIRRDLGNTLANGVNMAYFDLHGGYYDDPEVLQTVQKTKAIRTEALGANRRSGAEILVLADEDSMHFTGFRNPIQGRLLVEQMAEMPFVAPFDTALLSDLDRIDMAPYHMVLVLNAVRLDAAQRRLLRDTVLKDNRHVVWLHAPGYFPGDGAPGDAANIADITGIAVAPAARQDGAAALWKNGNSGDVSIPLMSVDSFVVKDSQAEVLAARADDPQTGVIAKRVLNGWTSIYAGTAPLPRTLLRFLAKEAGVHLWQDRAEDAVYANSNWLTLAADSKDGLRHLHLPSTATVKDAFTGEVLGAQVRDFETSFRPNEVRMFRLEQTVTTGKADADKPWYKELLVGMEVGPTGAQFGADPADVGYAAKFSGKDIVNAQIEAGSQYLVIWGKDSEYAYYNSKVAPKCPGLGDRDPLQEAVDAAKPSGLPVVVYCVVQGNGYPLRQHPEYKMIDAGGAPIDRVCLNSGFLTHIEQVVDEMLAYGVAGFHIDMLDQGFGPPYGCWCDKCRNLFASEYGKPMPKGVTWDEDWDRMMTFRFNSSTRFEKAVYDHIKASHPEVSVDFNYHGNPPFSWEVGQLPVQHAHVGDFVTGESGVWGFGALNSSLEALFLQATDPDAPYQVVMQRGVRMYHDMTTRPLSDMRWEMMTLLMHGCQTTIVDKTPFDGTLDRVAYERYGQVFGEVHAKGEHFGFDHKPLREVGVYYSGRSRDWYGRETPRKYQEAFYGAHKAMVLEHLPVGFLLDENADASKLRAFPVVYLANTAILSDKEVALLKDYVSEGGKLLVTGQTGLYDRMGAPLDDSALSELIGAKLVRRLDTIDNHVAFPEDTTETSALATGIPRDWPFLVRGPAAVYAPTTAKPVGSLYKPVRTLRQQQGLEGTDWPNSPAEVVGPAMLVNRFGKGTVVCLACGPDTAIAGEYGMPEDRMLLRNAIRFLNPDPRVLIDAPKYVESVVTEGPESNTMRVHFAAYLTPPSSTSETRPRTLPGLIEDRPLYRARITLKQGIDTATAFNPGTLLTVYGNTVEAQMDDIHDVLVIRLK